MKKIADFFGWLLFELTKLAFVTFTIVLGMLYCYVVVRYALEAFGVQQ